MCSTIFVFHFEVFPQSRHIQLESGVLSIFESIKSFKSENHSFSFWVMARCFLEMCIFKACLVGQSVEQCSHWTPLEGKCLASMW